MTPLTWTPYRKSLAGPIVRLWNRAMGQQFPMSVRLFRQNTEGTPSYLPDDSTVVRKGDDVVGYILTKRFREADPLQETMGATGWIEALIVDPSVQRQGIGRDLLAWAIYRLRSQGAQRILAGSGLRHFLPGIPADLPGVADYFGKAGFRQIGIVHDIRGNLREFKAPPSAHAALQATGSDVRPCRAQDRGALAAFLQAEFPGRWRFDTLRYLELGHDPADLVLLWQGQQVTGFAHVYNWRSTYQGPPVFWKKLLGTHCGGLGPIGVAKGMRGKGLGLALLQVALEIDAQRGVENAVIDWTTLVDFYGKVGFTPWKPYVRMEC